MLSAAFQKSRIFGNEIQNRQPGGGASFAARYTVTVGPDFGRRRRDRLMRLRLRSTHLGQDLFLKYVPQVLQRRIPIALLRLYAGFSVSSSFLHHELEVLLDSMYTVGHALAQSEVAMQRAWGKHLLEDWRSLDLLRQKLADEPVEQLRT